MMTMTLRVALVLVCVATMFLMMKKIRQSKLQIEYAIFWILFSGVLIVFSLDCSGWSFSRNQYFSVCGRLCVPSCGNLCHHKLFVCLCHFCLDYEGVLYDHSYFPAGGKSEGAGAADGSGRKETGREGDET